MSKTTTSGQNSLNHTKTVEQVLQEEVGQIAARRKGALGDGPYPEHAIGLALSGGGIRSGTLNLGIIQGLAHMGMLPYIDYLSTVSGGGYIGTWLHAVIQRYGHGRPDQTVLAKLAPPDFAPPPQDPDGIITDPIYFLRKFSSYLAPDVGLFSVDFWTILVIWSRNTLLNQAILAPAMALIALLLLSIGMLSQINTNNFGLLIQTVVCIVALGVVTRVVSGGVSGIVQTESDKVRKNMVDRPAGAVVVSISMLIISAVLASSARKIITYQWCSLPSGVRELPLPPLLIAIFLILLALFFLLQFGSGFRDCCQRRVSVTRCAWYMVAFPFCVASATTAALFGALYWISSWNAPASLAVNPGGWLVIAWGPPLIMLVWLFGTGLHIGLMGIDFPDFGREWLSRVGAFLFLATVGWAGLFGMFIFGPWWMLLFSLAYAKTAATLWTAWLATTAAGVLSGSSSSTKGSSSTDDKTSNPMRERIAKLAPSVFMIGYLLLIGAVVHVGMRALTGPYPGVADPTPPAPPLSVQIEPVPPDSAVRISYMDHSTASWVEPLRPLAEQYWEPLQFYSDPVYPPIMGCLPPLRIDPAHQRWNVRHILMWVLLLVSSGLLMLLMSFRVNINEFSIHHFYKNRLVRCYLGASRGKARKGSGLTGFDSNDDIALADLLPLQPQPPLQKVHPDPAKSGLSRLMLGSKPVAPEKVPTPYFGPYPIINTTLNLNRGSDLAKQERKGASFVFTPLYSGYDPPPSQEDEEEKKHPEKGLRKDAPGNGYRLTRGYPAPDGLSIGTCMAISGAAANPNWGASTSPSVAFLLTIFNVRLGWWVGNTRFDAPSQRPGPRFALIPLINELLAQTDSRSDFVNLSDGGHFENFGVYELVRRRVRYIIVGDGEQDENYTFESLGGVIRKCRADFGVEIDINPQRIRPVKGLSTTHCVVGKIYYPATSTQTRLEGWLLYLKSSLTGDEPEDITQYKAAHPAFPHDPTPNQFFTESQFESYRRLGLHIVSTAFEDFEGKKFQPRPNDGNEIFQPSRIKDLFESLYRKWHPPLIAGDGVASRHTDRYSQLMKQLCDDPDLAHLDAQILYKGTNQADTTPYPNFPTEKQALIQRKRYFYCAELIQLMENVWSDLHFSERSNRNNPNHQGWMDVFTFWVQQPAFKETWAQSSHSYNPIFQRFFEDLSAGRVDDGDPQSPNP